MADTNFPSAEEVQKIFNEISALITPKLNENPKVISKLKLKELAVAKSAKSIPNEQSSCVMNTKNVHLKRNVKKKAACNETVQPFECHLCKAQFNTKDVYRRHMRAHDNQHRPFVCDQCGVGFKQSSTLKHHSQTHNQLSTVKCRYCDKLFAQNSSRNRHELSHAQCANRIKQFSCDQCHKVFAQKQHLKVHKRTHQAFRPFQCDQCSKQFKYNHVLLNHQRTHTGEKPFVCPQCDATFGRLDHHKSHIRRVHRN